MKLLSKSLLAVVTISTASAYYAQSSDSLKGEKNIEEVVITGVADIAKDRKTPVAVSTIKETAIVEKLGNQEFPEVLSSTPSVYTTKSGGGFGDSKINIRGFGQENIAVMVNGMPVNDMENSRVYWSNWSGIADVTSAMQVQRGLGSSKLAISSVGGTINIVTRSSDKKQGGKISLGVGNDGFFKTLVSYNTGKSSNGWSSSLLFSRTSGDGYVDGTKYEGYNYYIAVGYQPSKKHDLQFTFTGAPQWHHQRRYSVSIADAIKYGGSIDTPNRRYNSDWGYLNGEEYSAYVNYFHKPIMSLNWDWKINNDSKLSTVVYASFGRGGGNQWQGGFNVEERQKDGTTKTVKKGYSYFRNADGLIDFEEIKRRNQSSAKEQIVRTGNINQHDWYGFLTNFSHKINSNWNFSVGLDGRYYKGYHYNILSDLVGASGYTDKANKNYPAGRLITNTYESTFSWNPFQASHKDADRIAWDNTGNVFWGGVFGQLEYSKDDLSAFVQGSVSNQSFQRIDTFIIDGVTKSKSGKVMNIKTKYENILGYNVKGGANYNIDEHHNVFANVGYYEKQPFFNSVYRSNENMVSDDYKNEKIFGIEVGYGFRSSIFDANVNLYRTSWRDRYDRKSNLREDATNTRYYAELNGIAEIHQGVEVDAALKLGRVLSVNGAFSIGDWFYKGNADATLFNEANNEDFIPQGKTSNKIDLLLDGTKVGDAAQITASLGVTVNPFKGFKFDANWRYVDRLYARLDVYSYSDPTYATKGNLRLPSYNLVDLGASYTLPIKDKKSFVFRVNVNNVFDTYYIADSYSAIHVDAKTTQTYKGIDVRNQVNFGFGRTWNASVGLNF